jgi:hypothetical protein
MNHQGVLRKKQRCRCRKEWMDRRMVEHVNRCPCLGHRTIGAGQPGHRRTSAEDLGIHGPSSPISFPTKDSKHPSLSPFLLIRLSVLLQPSRDLSACHAGSHTYLIVPLVSKMSSDSEECSARGRSPAPSSERAKNFTTATCPPLAESSTTKLRRISSTSQEMLEMVNVPLLPLLCTKMAPDTPSKK